MFKIEFEYHDSLSRGPEWSKQSCIVSSIDECKKIYGLDIDPDCEYRILSITEI